MPALSEFLFVNNSRTLSNGDQLIHRHVWKDFSGAVGPADGQLYASFRTESKVQATVIGGVEAGLGRYFLRLALRAVACDHAGTDGAAIGLNADQQDFQPVAGA